jgi:hypothetical protein
MYIPNTTESREIGEKGYAEVTSSPENWQSSVLLKADASRQFSNLVFSPSEEKPF